MLKLRALALTLTFPIFEVLQSAVLNVLLTRICESRMYNLRTTFQSVLLLDWHRGDCCRQRGPSLEKN